MRLVVVPFVGHRFDLLDAKVLFGFFGHGRELVVIGHGIDHVLRGDEFVLAVHRSLRVVGDLRSIAGVHQPGVGIGGGECAGAR